MTAIAAGASGQAAAPSATAAAQRDAGPDAATDTDSFRVLLRGNPLAAIPEEVMLAEEPAAETDDDAAAPEPSAATAIACWLQWLMPPLSVKMPAANADAATESPFRADAQAASGVSGVPAPAAAMDTNDAGIVFEAPMADAATAMTLEPSAASTEDMAVLTPATPSANTDISGPAPSFAAIDAFMRSPVAVELRTAETVAAPPSPLSLNSADMGEIAADLGERIDWTLDQELGEATVELHPAELGSLVIRIETRGEQTQVSLAAAEPMTRMLLAQALPQLREMFSGQGLHLGRAQLEREMPGMRAAAADAVDTRAGSRRRVSRVFLVDAYA